MKRKDVALLEAKIKDGGWLTLSHLKSFEEPNGYVKIDINENGSGMYFLAKNLKSALLTAEKAIESGSDVELKNIVNAPDTNLDYLLRHDLTIQIHSTDSESGGKTKYNILTVEHINEDGTSQKLYSTQVAECNGILLVLQIAEREWAQHIIEHLSGKNSAVMYAQNADWNNF